MAAAKGLPHRAMSCGLAENFERFKNPGPMSPDALIELEQLGIQVKRPVRMPRKLSGTEVAGFDIVICLDKKEHHPLVKKRPSLKGRKVIYWKIKDLAVLPAAKALPVCRRKIDQLIEMLPA